MHTFFINSFVVDEITISFDAFELQQMYSLHIAQIILLIGEYH